VSTGGKTRGCEKGGGVGVGVPLGNAGDPEIFVVLANLEASPATPAAITAISKALRLIGSIEALR
jgi:hypothetical protein